MSVLEDELADLEEDLKDSEDLAGGHESSLPAGPRDTLKGLLDRAESRIVSILDPNQNPSLDPPDSGSADTSVNPATLSQSAQTCHQLATEARTEIQKPAPGHTVIGSKLRTIKHVLPTYRQQAGIT